MIVARLIGVLFGLLLSAVWRPDGDNGATPPAGDTSAGDGDAGGAGDPPADPPVDPAPAADEAKPYRTLVFASKQEEEDHYSRTFKSRHRRMKKDVEEELREEIRDEVASEIGEDKVKAEQIATRRKAKIDTLESRVEELENEVEAKDGEIEQAERDAAKYRDRIEEQWKSVEATLKESHPHVLELIADRDVLDRIAYVDKHKERLNVSGDAPQDARIIGSPETPQDRIAPRRTDAADKEAAEQQSRTMAGAL